MRTLGVMIGLLVAPAAVAQSPTGDAEYNLACGADQRVTAAVERSLQGLSRLIRPMARPRLQQASDWCRKYTFDVQGDAVTVSCDGEPRWATALTESTEPYTDSEGRTGVIAVQSSERRLDVTTRFEEGERQTVFDFDGDTVRVREAIRSPRLEIPVEWELVYQRTEPAIATEGATTAE